MNDFNEAWLGPNAVVLLDAPTVTALIREVKRLRHANDILVRWKGEVENHLIAHRVEFPPDYENSPMWAVAKLIDVETAPLRDAIRLANGTN